LVAEPNPVRVCDQSGFGTTELSWGDLDAFEVHVGSADGPLFAATQGGGSTMTGKWVGDGTVFVLVDKASGETIQTLPVNATVLGCVGNAPGTYRGKPGSQWTNWLDHPSRVACGSCHSDIDFENGVGHYVMTDDHLCSVCHEPTMEPEFSWTSVGGVHLSTYKSAQFPGALFQFVDITNTGPGQKPTVTFKFGTKTGTLDANNVNRLRLAISGPNTDFYYYNQETVSGAVFDGEVWSYTFAEALPADAEGSYTVSVEGRNTATVNGSNQNDVIQASTMAFAVTSDVEPRRTVVEDYNCESCHVNLSLHGGGRNNANYCVTCHMPLATDEEELRPGNPEQTIHFKYMIHSIHRGENLVNGFQVAGHNQSIADFGEVAYPGDLRNCSTCHVNDSYQLSGLPDDLLPTLTPQAWWSPMQPQAAACLSCHDGDSTAVHAYTNSSFFGESCVTCHGEGKEYAVDKVHAR
jgi:OmcA/MtrC family decaheme c-type cytochrome